ncbi:mannan-binding lectin serine protease 1 [Gastrophryne carolinensis]
MISQSPRPPEVLGGGTVFDVLCAELAIDILPRLFQLFFPILWLLTDGEVIVLREMYGEIRTPNFPELYPSDSEVTWNMTVPEGFRIKLYFIHFDLEPSYLCEYDYAKVETEDQVLATFCGKESTDTEQAPGKQVIVSPGNFLSLTFRSDFSNEERFTGFDAHYSAVDVDECAERNDEDLVCDHHCHNYIGGFYCSCRFGYILHSDNRTCKVECSDNLYTQRSGTITSGDFPNAYPKSSDCLYRIELEEGFVVNLHFDDNFDIEDHPEVSCPYDYLKIKAGKKEFGPICGVKSPGNIETGSNSVQILFHSDNSGENGGWKLTYTVTGVSCPNLQAPLNGKIEPAQSTYTFKDQAVITCNPGFRVQRDNVEMNSFQIECTKDGTWSNPVPKCQIVDCKMPKELENGFVTFPTLQNTTTYRSTLTYSCREPYYTMTPNIAAKYSCNENGQWINSEIGSRLPVCQPVCGKPVHQLPGIIKRIIGGRNAEPGFFPWQVLIVVEDMSRVPENKWFGSGALLSDYWVLTAAHVLKSQRRDNTVMPVSKEHVTVYLGLHDVRNKTDSITRSIDKIILHEEFDPKIYNHDIALVRLKEKVVMNQYIMPVCLPEFENELQGPQPNTLGLVAGWGISNPNITIDEVISSGLRTLSDVLQYVKLPVVLHAECKASYESRSGNYSVTDNMFCAGYYEGGKDTCLGDSGGAFVIEDTDTKRWVAQGLVSWGGPEECGSKQVYGVYTKVSNYVNWLDNQILCGIPRFSRSKLARIVGGIIAYRGASPWIAMISDAENRPFCGGSLIGNKWIVTAAHCLHRKISPEDPGLTVAHYISLSSFNIILGKYRTFTKDDSEQLFRAKNFFLHPGYDPRSMQNDIALVELSEKAFLNDYVMPICLPGEQVQSEDFVVVSGWGRQLQRGQTPEVLMETEVPVVAYDVCETAYNELGLILTEDMICAGLKEGGKDSCRGDSGGPMITFSLQKYNWFNFNSPVTSPTLLFLPPTQRNGILYRWRLSYPYM